MAIKINSKNLAKRIIDGKEVEKVILNGAEIRPNEVPHINYHVINDFSSGGGGGQSGPSGWSLEGGSTSGAGFTGGTATYTGVPSLANANRIKIVYELERDPSHEGTAFISRFNYNNNIDYINFSILKSGNWRFYIGSNNGSIGSREITNPIQGKYIVTIDIKLVYNIVSVSIECPSGTSFDGIENSGISGNVVNGIRRGYFNITLGDYMTLSKCDFYIYNNSYPSFVGNGMYVPYGDYLEDLGYRLGRIVTGESNIYEKYLHMPAAGYINYDGTYQNDGGIYLWSSENTYGYCELVKSINGGWNNDFNRSGFAYNIRPFYSTYIEPDSSWIVEYGTLGGRGVFHNPSSGIISIKDTYESISISDKNLGATTVYNYGDAITSSNTGGFYQWGNCYGFPTSGFQTSSTQVDVSSYGDGTYYTDDVFITSNSWMATSNSKLRP